MRVEFDRHGMYVVRHVHHTDIAAVDALATAFTTYESTLPVAERSPHTDRIIDLLSRIRLLTNRQTLGRNRAAPSSDAVKRSFKHARKLARQIQHTLNTQFVAAPKRASAWGFQVRLVGQLPGAVLPETYDEMVAMLETYIAREQSRPPAEQFAVPALAEVIQVCNELRAQVELVRIEAVERGTDEADKRAVTQELVDFLQAALVYLVVTRFERKVTPELVAWGYEVGMRKSTAQPNQPSSPAEL
jgi:hypothetical protein